MLAGSLYPPLEKHQGAKRLRRATILPQQVQPKRKTNSQKSGQKPRRKETH
jgi:hypothetical protein